MFLTAGVKCSYSPLIKTKHMDNPLIPNRRDVKDPKRKGPEVLVLNLKRLEVKERLLCRWVGALQIQRLGGSRPVMGDVLWVLYVGE